MSGARAPGLVRLALPTAEVDLDTHGEALGVLCASIDGDVVSLLQAIQRRFGFLPANVLAEVSRRTGVRPARLYGVASFYRSFSLVPRGRTLVRFCTGTACHVAGGGRVLERLASHLEISPGSSTADMRLSLETAGCLGCCSLAPVMGVGSDMHGKLDGDRAVAVVDAIEPPGGDA